MWSRSFTAGAGCTLVFAALAVPAAHAHADARASVPAAIIAKYTGKRFEDSGYLLAANDNKTVLMSVRGPVYRGAVVDPTNFPPPAGYDGIQAQFSDVNAADLAVGFDQTSQGPLMWQVSPDNAATDINVSGLAPYGAAKVVDDQGEIAGTLQDSNGVAINGFYMSSPTSAPVQVASPTGSGVATIVAMNKSWQVFDVTTDSTRAEYLVNRASAAKAALTCTGTGITASDLASDGTTICGSVLRLPDGTTRTLAGPSSTPAIANDHTVVAGGGSGDLTMYAPDGTATDLNTVTGTGFNRPGTITPSGAIIGLVGGVGGAGNEFDVYAIDTGKPPPVVNSTGDAPATSAGSQGCTTGKTVSVNGASAPECTLRAAIQAENAGSVAQKSITFALPTDGANPGTVSPATPLPALTADGVTIDGSWNGATVSLAGPALTGTAALLSVSGGHDVVQDVALCQAPTALLMGGTTGGGSVRAVTVCASASAGKVTKGVLVTSPGNTIGGAAAADRNVVDNATYGIRVQGSAARGNIVQGNWVGVSPDGTTVLGHPDIEVVDASSATVGGVAASPGATPGNVSLGAIEVIGQGATVTGAKVQGNLVGLMPDGSTPPSSIGLVWGMTVWGTVTGAVLGGPGGARNVVNNASGDQITLNGTQVDHTVIENNLLGTDVSGSTPVPGSTNDPRGIEVDGAHDTQVGAAGLGNVIAAQRDGGILVNKRPGTVTIDSGNTPLPGTGDSVVATSTAAVIRDNMIGPASDGTTLNGDSAAQYGVQLSGVNDTLGPDNTIAGNETGVLITFGGNAETVIGNRIGTDPTGTKTESNGIGVHVTSNSYGAAAEQIGIAGSEPNVISGNLDDIALDGPATVVNNDIGTVANGLSALPAPAPAPGSLPTRIVQAAPGGVAGPLMNIANTADGSVIGGPRAGFGNVISGSPTDAVVTAAKAAITGNDIGVGIDGSTAVPNSGAGVRASAAAVIGAPAPGGRGAALAAGGNTIADNKGGGVVIGGGATGVQVLSNQIRDNTGSAITLSSSTANGGVSAPAITAVAQDGTSKGSTGHTIALVIAAPESTVQIYAATNCTAGGGQGASVLATTTADGEGNATIALPLQAVGAQVDATDTTVNGTSAFSQCYSVAPAAAGSNTTSPVKPGDTQDTQGSGFDSGETVDASVHSTPVTLGSQIADGDGDVSFSFAVPVGLEPGTHYVVLTGETSGKSVAVPFVVSGVVTTPGVDGSFGPSGPARVLDTRYGTGAAKGPVAAAHTVAVSVTGANGIPSTGVSAVVLNVTVTGAANSGFVSAYADGADRPTVSNLNFVKGQTVPNLVIAPVGADGKVDLYTSASTQLIADVAGYYLSGAPTAAGTFGQVAPARVLDTRFGVGAGKAPVKAGHAVTVQVTGANGVPSSGVSAVAVNVTVTAPTGSGFVTAYGSGTRPTASNLNYVKGQTVPNLVIVPVSSSGTITLYTSNTTQLLADLAGYFTTGAPTVIGAYGPVTPTRLLDTRANHGKPVPAGHTVTVKVTGRAGVPTSGVSAVVLNVTATASASHGYVTAYPGGTRPNASNLNYAKGQTVPNLVTVPVSSTGTITLYTSATTHLITDIAGYYKAGTA